MNADPHRPSPSFGTTLLRPQPRCLGPADQRGRTILYHRGIANPCPGCGKQQWFIGRQAATCAFCETTLPLACPLGEPTHERNS